uniref:G-protein coupled receptors family 1 profile domain-containing protein n=1 Tax=Podarcis muralis TaxID=64176 RepID=A0A670JH18_PODMU
MSSKTKISNESSVSEFLLLEFSAIRELQILHFSLFLALYLATVFGNLLIISAVAFDHHLHTPMYFFLMNLDLGAASVTIPKSMDILCSSSIDVPLTMLHLCSHSLLIVHLERKCLSYSACVLFLTQCIHLAISFSVDCHFFLFKAKVGFPTERRKKTPLTSFVSSHGKRKNVDEPLFRNFR